MNFLKVIDGIEFRKSSISGKDHNCVGVSISSSCVVVTSFNNPGTMIEFTHKEWEAFIGGVKLGEFEVKEA